MLTRRILFTLLILSFTSVCALAQATPAPAAVTLEPGKPIQREIAAGESHAYPIKLSSGEFMRVAAVQKGTNIVIELADTSGKKIWQADFSSNFGGQESLSYAATAPGEYQIILRPSSNTARRGTYELLLDVKSSTGAGDQKRISAERLLMEAVQALRQSNHQAGIEKALQALPIWRDIGDAYWEAETLSALGSTHNSTKKFDQAAEFYNQALVLRQRIKDRAGESNVLSDLGIVAGNLSKPDQSLAYFSQALEIKRELKDRAGEARILSLTANATYQLARYAQVITYSEQMLEIYLSLGDQVGIAEAHNLKGTCYYNLGRQQDAIDSYEKAIDIDRKTNNRRAESLVLHNLGLAKQALEQYDEAQQVFEKTLAIKRDLKDRESEGVTLTAMGRLLANTGEHELGVKYLNEALSIARESANRNNEVGALINIAPLYQAVGQNEEAFKNAEAALSIAQSLKSPYLVSRCYRTLESLGYQQGLYEKAIEFQEQLLVIDRDTKNRRAETNDLIGMAGNYRNLGRYERSLELLNQALALSREDKLRTAEGYALENIGIVLTSQAKYGEAVGYHEQAGAIFRDVKNRGVEGRTLINLGECFLKLGHADKSITLSNQALSLMRELKDRDGESISLGNLGAAYNASGQFAKAAETLSQALKIAREVGKPDRLREALNELARLERNQGNLAKASEYLDQSLKSLEKSRSEIYSPQSRAAFLAAEQQSLLIYVDLLMLQRRSEPGTEALALEASERSRARVFLDLLNEASIDIRQDVDAELVAQERGLGKKVNTWAERLEQATKPSLVARLKLELSQLESDLEQTQVAIRKSSPQYAALVRPQPLKLGEIQRQLDADTVLLEYSLGEDRSYLWAVTRDSLTSYELPKGELIKQSALEVYELLTARSASQRGESALERRERIAQTESKLPAAARTLSQTLLAPVAAQLGNKRLVIVADGALHYIPFAMLPDPASGNRTSSADAYQPLIINHEVVSLPSASALAIKRTEVAGRQVAPKLLAVIADPVFDRTDGRFKSMASKTADKDQAQTIAFNDVRSIEHLAEKSDAKAGTATQRLIIPRLPFTRQEADQLLTLAPKTSSFRRWIFRQVAILS